MFGFQDFDTRGGLVRGLERVEAGGYGVDSRVGGLEWVRLKGAGGERRGR